MPSANGSPNGGGYNAVVKTGKGVGAVGSCKASETFMRKDTAVQFFLEADAGDKAATLVRAPVLASGRGAKLLQSHGWLEGTLAADFDGTAFDEKVPTTWPLVTPQHDVALCDRAGKRPAESEPRRVRSVRAASGAREAVPLLSLVFVRWGGKTSDKEDEPNDGDWGKFGSPPSDEYMKAVVEQGIAVHPRLKNDHGRSSSYEVYHMFVKSSRDVQEIAPSATRLNAILKGKKKTMFWMLWPGEWEDFDSTDYACYIERQSLFGAMRACEAAGLNSGFPHPADQFELITSKTWMASLSLHPGARLPAGCLVSKGSLKTDAKRTAEEALAALEHIRRANPFVLDADDPPAPSVVNKDGIKKGVVKVGFSWENRFVSVFNGLEQLQACLEEMLNQEGCLTSSCLVQEWVDFDFEMRLYFLPAGEWPVGTVLQPMRTECNAWGTRDEGAGKLGQSHASFSKLSRDAAIEKWQGDAAAFDAAQAEATEVAQFLLAWLLAANTRPVAMVRLDFMIKRLRPGKARVIFGEYCEMGACCLGWQEGPPTIWRAALDAALR